jgi:hypothetical protein
LPLACWVTRPDLSLTRLGEVGLGGFGAGDKGLEAIDAAGMGEHGQRKGTGCNKVFQECFSKYQG